MSEILKPIEHRTAYTRAVEREVMNYFKEAMFAPLQIVLLEAGVKIDPKYQAIKYDEAGRVNAFSTAIETALREGRIYYADGIFSGKFSSSISRELKALGATFDASAKTFRISPSAIPLELRGILAQSAAQSKAVNTGILDVLQSMQTNLASAKIGLQLGRVLTAIETDLGKQLYDTVTTLKPEEIGLKPQIDAGVRAAIDQGFTRNLELGIKNFAQARIPELRRRVEQNALEFGGRTDRLAKIIEAEFGVTQRKAEFLADQETGLLVSKYRQEKYKALGISDYIWSTSHDARVRHSHAILDGKRFSFAVGALVTDPGKPARYCNPGEDYRCRCVPRPIINLAEIAA